MEKPTADEITTAWVAVADAVEDYERTAPESVSRASQGERVSQSFGWLADLMARAAAES